MKRLVACKACRAQYDVTSYPKDHFACRCGTRVEIPPPQSVHANIHRCSSCGASIKPTDPQCGYCHAYVERNHLKRTLICPDCFTSNPNRARFCSGCGEAFRPSEVKEEGTGKNCPDCNMELLRRSLVEQEIAECPHCAGIWVGRHAFEELVDRAAARESSNEIRSFASRRSGPTLISKEGGKGFAYRKCPDCGVMMHRKRFKRISDVVTDQCAIHGVWLDADELGAIARFVAEGGLARADAHEARERAADAEHTVIVTTCEGEPASLHGIPEELLEALDDEDFDGEIEQEIVIEHEDGRLERRTRTIRSGDAKFRSIIEELIDE